MTCTNHEMFSVILPLLLQSPPQIRLVIQQEENVDADNKYTFPELAVFPFIFKNTPTRCSAQIRSSDELEYLRDHN